MNADSSLVDILSPSPNFGDRRGKAIDALVLHYTGMSAGVAARARLLDPASEVSCHYLVWEDGRIEQMVAEADRAWHAGQSYWAGETDMNAVSIGIEIVNAGHDGGCPPYPEPQIEAVIALSRDISVRRSIAPRRVLAHSDIAPGRKTDPGEWFPWAKLAAAGVGLWISQQPEIVPADEHISVIALQQALAMFGYHCPLSGQYDQKTLDVLQAFHRHYQPNRLNCGDVEASAPKIVAQLLALRP